MTNRLRAGLFLLGIALAAACSPETGNEPVPNILLIISDDQSWEHLGCYGDPAIRTPVIDKLAEGGVLFENAYTACPSCSPARAALLTGQDIYRIQEAGVLTGFIRDKYDVFPLILEAQGYQIGYTGKGYWPQTKDTLGAIEEPFGKNYRTILHDAVPEGVSRIHYSANFSRFIDENTEDKPFFFMAGLGEPHRPYETGRGMETGIDTSLIRIPEFMPDVPVSKLDMADYMAEIEWCDQVVGEFLNILDSRGLRENTLIIFTSDNGMPFPRSKASLYDHGVRMPLIANWEGRITANRMVSEPVSLIDLAPTFLDLSQVEIPEQMSGKSIQNLLFSDGDTSIDPGRNFVVTAFEKHTHCRPDALGFPRRAIHTREWTLILNYEAHRYPMGNLDVYIPNWDNLGDTDPGPLKSYYKEKMDQADFQYYWDLSFGKVPGEELFNKFEDPDMVHNLAGDPDYKNILEDLRNKLMDYLSETNDPRAKGLSPWDNYKLDK